MSEINSDTNVYYFLLRKLSETGKTLSNYSVRVEAPDVASAKKIAAKTWPDSVVWAVSQALWEAPRVLNGPKREGQYAKESRARKASYAKLK